MSTAEAGDHPGPQDSEVTVQFVFADGERRTVSVSSDEARVLRRRGSRVARGGHLSRAGRALGPVGKWVAVTVVAALLGAEISDRYAARQRELEIEAELATAISVSAVQLFQDAQGANRDRTDGQRDLREDAANAWVRASSSVDPVFLAYYGNEVPTKSWDAYQEVMYDWGVLACCTDEGRAGNIARVRSYVEGLGPGNVPPPVEDPWAAMNSAQPPTEVYQWVGFRLMAARGDLFEDVKSGTPDLD